MQEKYRYSSIPAWNSFQKALPLCWGSAKTGDWLSLSTCFGYCGLSNRRSALPAAARLLCWQNHAVVPSSSFGLVLPWWGVQPLSMNPWFMMPQLNYWVCLYWPVLGNSGCTGDCGRTHSESKQMPFLKTDPSMETADSGLGVWASKFLQTDTVKKSVSHRVRLSNIKRWTEVLLWIRVSCTSVLQRPRGPVV